MGVASTRGEDPAQVRWAGLGARRAGAPGDWGGGEGTVGKWAGPGRAEGRGRGGGGGRTGPRPRGPLEKFALGLARGQRLSRPRLEPRTERGGRTSPKGTAGQEGPPEPRDWSLSRGSGTHPGTAVRPLPGCLWPECPFQTR
jgi:hypothetical protein